MNLDTHSCPAESLMGRVGLHPRNEFLFGLVPVMGTEVGRGSVGAFVDALPDLEEPRLGVLTRLAVAVETWIVEREKAAVAKHEAGAADR